MQPHTDNSKFGTKTEFFFSQANSDRNGFYPIKSQQPSMCAHVGILFLHHWVCSRAKVLELLAFCPTHRADFVELPWEKKAKDKRWANRSSPEEHDANCNKTPHPKDPSTEVFPNLLSASTGQRYVVRLEHLLPPSQRMFE